MAVVEAATKKRVGSGHVTVAFVRVYMVPVVRSRVVSLPVLGTIYTSLLRQTPKSRSSITSEGHRTGHSDSANARNAGTKNGQGPDVHTTAAVTNTNMHSRMSRERRPMAVRVFCKTGCARCFSLALSLRQEQRYTLSEL